MVKFWKNFYVSVVISTFSIFLELQLGVTRTLETRLIPDTRQTSLCDLCFSSPLCLSVCAEYLSKVDKKS